MTEKILYEWRLWNRDGSLYVRTTRVELYERLRKHYASTDHTYAKNGCIGWESLSPMHAGLCPSFSKMLQAYGPPFAVDMVEGCTCGVLAMAQKSAAAFKTIELPIVFSGEPGILIARREMRGFSRSD